MFRFSNFSNLLVVFGLMLVTAMFAISAGCSKPKPKPKKESVVQDMEIKTDAAESDANDSEGNE